MNVIVQGPGDTAAWAAGGAAAGALVGGFVAYMATRRQVSAMEAEGERQRTATATERAADRAHELFLAREEREQRRKIDAYVGLMAHGSWGAQWARWRLLTLTHETVLQEPLRPERDFEASGLSLLVMSDEAGGSLEGFNDALNEFTISAVICEETIARHPEGAVEAIEEAQRSYQSFTEAALALRQQLRRELAAVAPGNTD